MSEDNRRIPQSDPATHNEQAKRPRAVAAGKLPIGNITLDCYVLDDEIRVISQRGIGKQANAILRSLAGVGIAALIDEATGYQAVRKDNALRRIFDRLLHREADVWEMLWTPDVVGSLCKVFHVPYEGKGFPKVLANVAGEVYSIVLGATVHDEVRRLNPDRPDRDKHHQFFKGELRQIAREDLSMVKAIADQSMNKSDFWARMRRHFRGDPLQLGLA